jgi:hypothetical protein
MCLAKRFFSFRVPDDRLPTILQTLQTCEKDVILLCVCVCVCELEFCLLFSMGVSVGLSH